MKNRFVISVLALYLLMTGCATGPIDYPRTHSEIIQDTQDTRLGREAAAWRQEYPRMSGFYPLLSGMDALGARLAMIDMAERTIDAQYFLMKSDTAGLIFVGKLLEAADRGVRVRFLLDDIFTSVDDQVLLLLDQHPNVEMRLFNPIGRSGSGLFNFVGDFKRANRRMHNKSLTVDNQVSIVGGRNIAEEYFELKAGEAFHDLDMLATGSVASEIGVIFDRFWNHALSVPMKAFSADNDNQDIEAARAEVSDELRQATQTIYARAVESDLLMDLLDDRIPMFPAAAEVITDDPEKLLNKVSADHQTLVTRMAEVVANADFEVIVVTPYFIPGATGVEFWHGLAERGIRVVILTNSLASNNHIPVHAAYARYRHPIIRAGVELYEMRADATEATRNNDDQAFESATLHAKAIFVDRKYTFIGSLNLDPRSIDINTEMGVLVKSADMTEGLVEPFLTELADMAYRVTESKNGKLRWHATIDGADVIEHGEPQAGYWRRFKAFLSRVFPESQL